MTAAAVLAAVPKATSSAAPGEPATDQRSLELAARLAGAILRPIKQVDDSFLRLAPLTAQHVRAASALPAFASAINRAVRSDIESRGLALPRDFGRRLADRSSSRLAVLLVTEPIELINRAARMLAGAILHRQVLALMLKDQRAAARAVMGEEAFLAATQEVPMLNPSLGLLDKGRLKIQSLIQPDIAEAQKMRFLAFGGEALCRFTDTAEASLSSFFACRLPPAARPDDSSRAIAGMTEGQCTHVIKLLRRRLPEWADFIS